MEFSTIEYSVEGSIATITMNRPEVLNALNGTMREELYQSFNIAADTPDVRVVILTGKGRGFSSGADLKDVYDRPSTSEGWRDRYLKQLDKLIAIWNYPKPTISAVNGYALGEGCDLALVTDITIASVEAKFGWPEIRMPGMEFLLVAPWLIGMKRAKELLFTGEMISGDEASRIGLVNKAVPPEQLLETAISMAQKICNVPPASIRRNKMAVNRAFEMAGMTSSWWYNHELAITSAWDRELNRAERDKIVKEKGLKAYLDQRDAPFKDK